MARSTTTSTPAASPRLWLESPRTPSPVVHGCWWPRSADPAAELPALVLALDALGSPIVRVRVSAAGWSRRPHEVDVAGRPVTVGYFSGQSTGLLTASCAGGGALAVRVVPWAGPREADWDVPESRAAAS
ncbi:hypothetical protein GCM10020358_43160 [Amorphoplanes nipponensis]|uniref:Uncharacterized protein n=1 Tax=Actinoplanes nipponensis TaxID=135950 RepID=A0A919JVJ5_9ACTN|nr:DUF5994 family protein [Actinoplanes nipponensis]GIE53784.1 hypothetical protein Ani05nite_73180 [Actinoplanes nipponensis]